jgi:hypothetical protein
MCTKPLIVKKSHLNVRTLVIIWHVPVKPHHVSLEEYLDFVASREENRQNDSWWNTLMMTVGEEFFTSCAWSNRSTLGWISLPLSLRTTAELDMMFVNNELLSPEHCYFLACKQHPTIQTLQVQPVEGVVHVHGLKEEMIVLKHNEFMKLTNNSEGYEIVSI